MPSVKKKSQNLRLSVQTTEEWLEWVELGAHHCHLNVSNLVEYALRDYLKRQHFTTEPPRRAGR